MPSYEDGPARVGKLSIVGGPERPNTTTPRVVENRTAMRILRAARLRLWHVGQNAGRMAASKVHPRGAIRRGFFHVGAQVPWSEKHSPPRSRRD